MERAPFALLLLPLVAAPAAAQCELELPVPRAFPKAAGVGTKILFADGIVTEGWSLGGAGGVPSTGTLDARVDIYDTATGQWSLAKLSQGRGGMAVATVGSQVLFAGGVRGEQTSDRVDIYDDVTGTWSSATLSEGRAGIAAATVGTKVLFAGGFVDGTNGWAVSATVDVYDAATGAWSTLPPLPVPRANMDATGVGTKALFAGGDNATWWRVDIYDDATGQWSMTFLPTSRGAMAALTIGTKAYFVGGYDGAHGLDNVSIYDASTGNWSQDTLPRPAGGLAAARVGEVAVFAGNDTDLGLGVSAALFYDPSRELWWEAPLPWPLSNGFVRAAGAAAGDRALFGGGQFFPSAVQQFVEGFPVPECLGDGTEGSCPCGNTGARGAGCANSAGSGGVLRGAGGNLLCDDGLQLLASGLPAQQTALLFTAPNALPGGAPAAFGDGLRCVGGPVTRLGARTIGFGGSAEWGPGLAADGGWSAGDTRRFQAWYRDPSGPCSSGVNITNSVRVVFAP